MARNYSRRTALKLGSGLAAAALAAPSLSQAQSGFPDRPINVVVPFDTGGYNDRLARAFAPFLQEQLGQPLTIINRGGAGALLGHTFFLQQPDDGYTILCTSAAPYIPLNILTQDAPFTLEDFDMINLPSQDYTMMATVAGGDLTSVQDVIDQLKADPSSLSIGVQPASADLVNLYIFTDANGIDRDGLRVVTYDGGGPTRNATAGGVVDVGMVGGQGFLPLAEQIKPLLVFDATARDGWEVPALGEMDAAAEFVAGSQRGWGLHGTMSESHPEEYAILVSAIETASKDPAAIEALKAQDLATEWFGPEASNAALAKTFTVMETHLDLLEGS